MGGNARLHHFLMLPGARSLSIYAGILAGFLCISCPIPVYGDCTPATSPHIPPHPHFSPVHWKPPISHSLGLKGSRRENVLRKCSASSRRTLSLRLCGSACALRCSLGARRPTFVWRPTLAPIRDVLVKIDAIKPDRILTLGGDCAVSVAPFSALSTEHLGGVAVIWVDSHPNSDTPDTKYLGYHAMAVSALLGYGDDKIVSQLPYAFPADHIALVGVHAGEKDAFANVRERGPE